MTIPELNPDVRDDINETEDTVHTDDHKCHAKYLNQRVSQDLVKRRCPYNEWRSPRPCPCSTEFEIVQRSSLLLPCMSEPPASEAYGKPSDLDDAMSRRKQYPNI